MAYRIRVRRNNNDITNYFFTSSRFPIAFRVLRSQITPGIQDASGNPVISVHIQEILGLTDVQVTTDPTTGAATAVDMSGTVLSSPLVFDVDRPFPPSSDPSLVPTVVDNLGGAFDPLVENEIVGKYDIV